MDGKLLVITTDPYPFDPEGLCDRCGQQGTVVRSQRHDIPSAPMGRYCGACWPAQRAEQVRRSLEEGAQYATVAHDPAPSWDRLVALVVSVEQVLATAGGDVYGRRGRMGGARVAVAWEIRAAAGRLDGPMPQVVQDFLDRAPRPC